jgi:hypothetical protein
MPAASGRLMDRAGDLSLAAPPSARPDSAKLKACNPSSLSAHDRINAGALAARKARCAAIIEAERGSSGRPSASEAAAFGLSQDAESSGPDPTEKPKEDVKRSYTDFKIVYMDGSSPILKLVKRYEINDRWIEFRDALGQLQSVPAEDVRRISRLGVEDPTESEDPGAY